jgi:exopolysaccharide biosynthesis polyprenyl glycosylphosphotransferase
MPVHLGLQQRARRNLQRHVSREAVRVLVLLVADLAAFAGMRALLRAVRDLASLGEGVASVLRGVLPPGLLNGWQFAVALIVGLLVTGNYGAGDNRRDHGRLFLGSALAAALPLWMTIWTQGIEVVAVHYLLVVGLVWAGLLAERHALDYIINRIRRPTTADTLFVGRGAACRAAMAGRTFAGGAEFRPIGFIDLDRPAASGALGHIDDLRVLLAASGAEVVVLCGHLRQHELQEVVNAALTGGCQVLAVPNEVLLTGVEPMVVWRHGEPLMRLTTPALKGQQLFLKRIVDVVGAVVGIVVTLPITIVLAVAVRMTSPGPVFFRQERVGFGGRRFRILKFRTMTDGADAVKQSLEHLNQSGDPRLFKIPNDPRITPLGRWMRRWSLDELPQLWNVLVGEMSLVGPRPFFERDLALYEAHHFGRLGAKPGITGLWQVSGRSDITNFEEVVALDTRYVMEWSLLLDCRILLRTLPAVFRRNGAH